MTRCDGLWQAKVKSVITPKPQKGSKGQKVIEGSKGLSVIPGLVQQVIRSIEYRPGPSQIRVCEGQKLMLSMLERLVKVVSASFIFANVEQVRVCKCKSEFDLDLLLLSMSIWVWQSTLDHLTSGPAFACWLMASKSACCVCVLSV